MLINIACFAAGLILSLVFAVLLLRAKQKEITSTAKEKAKSITSEAQIKSKDMLQKAKHESQDILRDSKHKFDAELKKARKKAETEYKDKLGKAKSSEQNAKKIESKLLSEKKSVDDQKLHAENLLKASEQKEQEYDRKLKNLEQEEVVFEQKKSNLLSELEKVANMTQKEAEESLMKTIEDGAKLRAAKTVKAIEENALDDAEKLAKKVISTAISRYSSDYTPERTTSSITLQSDEIKGRLIGREGRNIRAFEQATGCDVIIDDTPQTVVISSFDPVRRFIGKQVMDNLIADGRVHPSRIEELVEKNTKKVDKSIKEAGDKAILELGIISMHPELLKIIGQLQFRYSYNQNQYHHVIEVSKLCGLMANELGLDLMKARRAGLLHDIGKALTHEVEGSHAVIGADLCAKYGEDPEVVYAVRAHHEDVKPKSALDFILMGADAISGARPGARHEQMDNYVRRLTDLERIANDFPGVERSFAINAGREIRILVENSRIDDNKAIVLSQDIAKKIEHDMTYPGQIKITVIRETRAVSMAK